MVNTKAEIILICFVVVALVGGCFAMNMPSSNDSDNSAPSIVVRNSTDATAAAGAEEPLLLQTFNGERTLTGSDIRMMKETGLTDNQILAMLVGHYDYGVIMDAFTEAQAVGTWSGADNAAVAELNGDWRFVNAYAPLVEDAWGVKTNGLYAYDIYVPTYTDGSY